MLLETFLGILTSELTSLVKEKFKKKRLRKRIKEAVHEAFTGQSQNLLALCMEKTFSDQLFTLARGEIVIATDLVGLGVSVAKHRKFKLSRGEIIEELKQFALKLNNIFVEIAPEAGKQPAAFSNFLRSVDNLSMIEAKAPIEARVEPAHFIVPHRRNTLLRHQEGWVEQIRGLLAEKGQFVISQSAAVSGQGGVGKTAMAVEYAYRYAKEYPGGVFWLQMDQGLGSAARVFCEVSANYGVDVGPWQELTEPELIQRVVAFLNMKPLKLVIVDNLEDNLLPRELTLKDAHLLVTTRRRSLSLPLIEMNLPEEQEALDIFLAYANRKLKDILPQERKAAIDICRRVDCLPLALEIIGQLARRRPLVSLAQKLGKELLHLEEPTTTKAKEQTSIQAALRLAEQEFRAPLAREGLIAAGYLNPEGIEAGILAGVLEVEEKKAEKVQEALADLSVLQLGEQAYTIHRLTQEVARLMDDDQAIGHKVALYVDQRVEKVSAQGVYRQAYNIIPHVIHLASLAKNELPEEEFPSSLLISRWALYLKNSGVYSPAASLLRTCLSRVEQAKGCEHRDYAALLDNLSLALWDQGRNEEAEGLHRQALDIDERTIGKDHPDYATHLNNLAGVLRAQGRYDEAEGLYQQALEIGEKTIGKDHPGYATGLSNLAGVLQDQGRYDEAEGLYRRAIEISRRALGPNHPQTRTIEKNLEVLKRKS